MTTKNDLHYWSVWFPGAAATGLLVARGMIEPQEAILFHAAPPTLTVEVTDEAGNRVAYGEGLERGEESPMCLLRRQGEKIVREDIWPGEDEIGMLVLLPGGEAGYLKSWWHAEDKKAWRWQVEFYNELKG